MKSTTRVIAGLIAVICLMFLAPMGAAEASLPVSQRAPSDVYHPHQGNDQAFSIICMTGHGPFWVQKGQYAWQKCQYGSNQAYSIDVGNNFNIVCRRLSDGAMQWIPGSYGPVELMTGSLNCWTNHN